MWALRGHEAVSMRVLCPQRPQSGTRRQLVLLRRSRTSKLDACPRRITGLESKLRMTGASCYNDRSVASVGLMISYFLHRRDARPHQTAHTVWERFLPVSIDLPTRETVQEAVRCRCDTTVQLRCVVQVEAVATAVGADD